MRHKLNEPVVDSDKAPVSEDVRRWPEAAGSPSPDLVRRSSISFKPKEPTLSSLVVVVGRAMRTDDWLVPTTPKDGATRAGRRHYVTFYVVCVLLFYYCCFYTYFIF